MSNGDRTPESMAVEHDLLGTAMTELISGYVRSLGDAPVCSPVTPAELEALFDEPLPMVGEGTERLLKIIRRDVVPNVMGISSPRYFGLFNPAPLPVAVWADALCSALNQNAAGWRNAPAASALEARVIGWLCELIGFGTTGFGTLTSGGSEANLIALKCARDRTARGAPSRGLAVERAGPLTGYASEQCHYSLVKSADIVGLGRDNLRKIDTGPDFHIRLDALREALDRDRLEGRPCCIVGVAGATSTGVIDPLERLADIAEEYGVWFHVDAAYGGALAFSDRHRDRLRGIERADSVTIDPHKWMFVPFSCGALLVRGGARVLRDAFDITPEYLSEQRGEGDDAAFDFFRYGQLGSRRGAALALWAALRHLGVRGYARIVDRHLELTGYLGERLDELADFERVGPIETAVCCARFLPPSLRRAPRTVQDDAQRALQQRIERTGRAWFATTVLHGRRALRININSLLTERRHIDELVDLLRREGGDLYNELPGSRP